MAKTFGPHRLKIGGRSCAGWCHTSPSSRLQFSEDIAGEGEKVFASAEQLGLEGIVSKRLGSHYRSGRADTWRKSKCWTETNLVLIGTEIDKRSGAPMALLARQEEDGLHYAGGAFFALKAAHRSALADRMARLSTDRSPIPTLRKRGAQWVKPELVVGVRHLRASGGLRHATVRNARRVVRVSQLGGGDLPPDVRTAD